MPQEMLINLNKEAGKLVSEAGKSNKEACKVHKHLIKWLKEIIKKRTRECNICKLLGDAFLIIQKVIVMLQKDGC